MFIAVDAGGTSTRAVAVDRTGHVLGYGWAGGGNPTSAGIPAAVAAIGAATEQAVTGLPAGDVEAVGIALAGEKTEAFSTQLSECLGRLGPGRVVLQPDLLAMFHSGTHRLDGYGLIAGTGSIAARVRDGRLHRVVGGRGWLLGDAGSGFWIGHRVARAVVAALDGQGPPTALTSSVLTALRIDATSEPALPRVVSALYARRPVQLSELAPLAFSAAEDPVAQAILDQAAAALADLLATVREPSLTGPVVVGGSVMIRGFLAGPPDLRVRLGLPDDVVPVDDGVVGSAVLALREAGIVVDEDVFARLRGGVARVRTGSP
jgi:N-acetylglucosamine kinase-like BadF-type ATPase